MLCSTHRSALAVATTHAVAASFAVTVDVGVLSEAGVPSFAIWNGTIAALVESERRMGVSRSAERPLK